MRRLAIMLVVMFLAGCGRAPAPGSPTPAAPAPPPPAAEQATASGGGPGPASTSAEPAAEPAPDLALPVNGSLGRAELRERLDRVMNTGDGAPVDKLRALFTTAPVAADLDGDGSQEYILVLPWTDPGTTHQAGQGAAIVVIYRQDGRYVADVSPRLSDRQETWLLAPRLEGIADLTGAGRPQIVWSRPAGIVTGLRPRHVFVTAWQPGSFTTLDGEMAISSTPKDEAKVQIDGRDVLLTGRSRQAMFLPDRTDRYRFMDGAFRLVDRRFAGSGGDAYSRFWDGLVAEDVGRIADAEQAYREAIDPRRQAHPGMVPQYNNFPVQLTAAEVAAFGEALRALARFRLGVLLLSADRRTEALDLMQQASGPYAGLPGVLLQAGNRDEGCRLAAAWEMANAGFLTALNRGVADTPWTPESLCAHEPLEDRIP